MPLIKYGDAQPITGVYDADADEKFDAETRKQLDALKEKVETNSTDSQSQAN